tara:strand:+ start:4189 stop:4437 length:249 start_codon:yes stop_codon:yes gene_type:complete
LIPTKTKKQDMATRGRPKGAKSFVNIDMETLNEYFGSKQHIPVSRVWLEKMNILIVEQEANQINASVKPTTEAGAVEFKITE